MAGIEIDGVSNKIELNTGAAAADQHILFNGNAQDFYIALDDSADDLLIGLGSTVGTTPIMLADENRTVTFQSSGIVDNFVIQSTNAGAETAPDLILDRSSASPADNDTAGKVVFRGRNDADESVEYAQITCAMTDVSNGAEDGKLEFDLMTGASSVSYMQFQDAGIVINEGSADIDFRIESNNYTHCLFVDAATDRVSIGEGTSTPGLTFAVKDSQNDIIGLFHNNLSSGNVFGLQINFTSTADDNTSYFFRCVGNNQSTVRAVIYSDGDIQNADNSYGSTSDERIKEQIKDANAQWDDIKALKIKNYKLKEDVADKGDSDDLWRLGVVAQDLETAGMNGLVKPEVKLDADSPEVIKGEGNVGDIRDYKGVKYSILYMKAVKALQEAMAKIETLETKVKALEDA